MLRSLARAVAAAALLALPSVASAQLATYTFSGTASGSLGGSNFTDRSYSFTLASTSLAQASGYPAGFPAVAVSSATLDIAGVTTGATLSTPLFVFVNPGAQGVGFGTLSGDFLGFAATGAGLNTYNLRSTFGPVTANAGILNQVTARPTSAGAVTFTQVASASFQANVSAVPEPATMALVGTGLAGLGLAARRRRRA